MTKKTEMPYKVYPEKRKRGWVLIHLTGLSRSSTSSELWKPALLQPRTPRVFPTAQEAREWAMEAHNDKTG